MSKHSLRRRLCRRHRQGGFSLLELMISLSIFGVIGYGLIEAVEMGGNSQEAVADAVESNEGMRSANSILSSELKLSSDDNITVVLLDDGNDQVTFMHPVQVAGVLDWGVFDATLGATEEEQNRPDWMIRYTVDTVVQGTTVNRRLVRQVLDDLDVIQSTEVVLEGLRRGDAEPRGFSVRRAGDMWEIQVTVAGATEGSNGQGEVFHVKTRN